MARSLLVALGLSLSLLGFAPRLSAQTCTPPPGALAWSDPATWPGGVLPGQGEDVEIPAGATVWVDVSPPALGRVRVAGRLAFACDDLDFTARRIEVLTGGAFEVGRSGRPNTGRVTITLTGDAALEERSFLVHGGGRLDLCGVPRGAAWTSLSQTADAGAAELLVDPPVPLWAVGERLLVTSTDYDLEQVEERTIVAVADAGARLVLDTPLDHPHWGTFEAGWIDHRAQVALLERNVVVQGDDTSPVTRVGGHMMFMAMGDLKPRVHMDWVRVRRMGWRATLAHYPVHFHQCRSVAGSFVRNCLVDDCYNRAITVHGTDDAVVEGNVSYGTFGHAYYLEDGTEVRNRFVGNLGLSTRALPEDEVLSHGDDRPGTFYWKSNDNVIAGNVAAGSEGSGFYQRLVPENLGDQELGVFAHPPTFQDNVAHSNRFYGFWADDFVHYSPDDPAYFTDFHAHHNSRSAVWHRSFGAAHWSRLRASDNGSGAYIASGGLVLRDRKGVTTLEGCLFVGESGNVGEPQTADELAHGRSLPLPTPERPLRNLVGLELYDGLVQVRDCTFVDYVDAVIGGELRRAAGLSQVHYDSPWQVDPRNSIEGSHFVNARPVWFRDGLLEQDVPRDNGIRHTALWDRDGCVTGAADSLLVAPNPFLAPRVGGHDAPEWNATVIDGPLPEARVAALHVRDGYEGGPFLTGSSPEWIALVRGLSGDLRQRSQLLGILADFPTVRSFPASLLVGEEYEVETEPGTKLRNFFVSLRFSEPRDAVLLAVSYPKAPSAVEKNYDHESSPRVPAVAANDLDHLRTGAADYWYDAAGKVLYLRPALGVSPVNPQGTTRFDGSMVFLRVWK